MDVSLFCAMVYKTISQTNSGSVVNDPLTVIFEESWLNTASNSVALFNDAVFLKATVNVVTNITLWISAVLTVISGVIYVIENKKYIDPKNNSRQRNIKRV